MYPGGGRSPDIFASTRRATVMLSAAVSCGARFSGANLAAPVHFNGRVGGCAGNRPNCWWMAGRFLLRSRSRATFRKGTPDRSSPTGGLQGVSSLVLVLKSRVVFSGFFGAFVLDWSASGGRVGRDSCPEMSAIILGFCELPAATSDPLQSTARCERQGGEAIGTSVTLLDRSATVDLRCLRSVTRASASCDYWPRDCQRRGHPSDWQRDRAPSRHRRTGVRADMRAP
jgi:hypothetical protein